VQLIFDRRVSKKTPGRFRTRIITDGVVPSLHVDYKTTRIKQYHKEGRALRPKQPSTTHVTSASASYSRTCLHCGRSASRPTGVSSTSKRSRTIARLAKTRLTGWFFLPK
jgi:hypothetical protein